MRMNKLTQEEAIKFHNWLRDVAMSEHKWEIMQQLDEVIGHCPTQTKTKKTKKKVMKDDRQEQTGGGET